jgi:hypothetical protein
MWQAAITLLIVAAVLVYLIRYFSRAYRSQSSVCSSCQARCAARGDDKASIGGGDCECPTPLREQSPEDGRSDKQ